MKISISISSVKYLLRIVKVKKAKGSSSPLPAPAFSLAGEKKFEKMRDVKVKDSKTIHIYILPAHCFVRHNGKVI